MSGGPASSSQPGTSVGNPGSVAGSSKPTVSQANLMQDFDSIFPKTGNSPGINQMAANSLSVGGINAPTAQFQQQVARGRIDHRTCAMIYV